jgi:large subunit ribosomal protein L5e
MAFIKNIKTKAYYKRFQTKFRRRREGKTDYYARKRLIVQDKNKYNTPKYRLVARITCSKVIAQVIYATIQGDQVLCAAESTELKRFGLEAGLTNYAAAYATGLLVARRLLRKTKLDTLYKGAAKTDGEDYSVANEVKEDAEKQPFKAYLDVGIIRTTTGNRVFAVLKGASDGGLYVPHSTRRYPGYGGDDKNKAYNPKIHRDRIFGLHVDKYMKTLKKKSADDYKRQFSKWDSVLTKNKVDSLEKLYTKVHEEIRKNPERPKKEAKQKKPVNWADKNKTIAVTAKGKYKKDRRLTLEQRKARVQKKIEKALKSK